MAAAVASFSITTGSPRPWPSSRATSTCCQCGKFGAPTMEPVAQSIGPGAAIPTPNSRDRAPANSGWPSTERTSRAMRRSTSAAG
jgi:hypothetical protein